MIVLSLDGGLARLTLDRPEVRNAIPLVGWDALSARVEEAEAGGARLLVLSGSGGAFCAGADLSEFGTISGSALRLAMRRGIDRIRALAIPSVAVVEGPCYGAGVALAMACDVRIAGAGARFAITPAKIGISYPQEDVHRLVELVGTAQAARLLFSAQSIDGAEAARIGLVDLVGNGEVTTAAMLANDADSLKVLKHGIRLAARGVRHDDGQDQSFDTLFGSEALASKLSGRSSG